MRIACSGLHFLNTIFHSQYSTASGITTNVISHDALLRLLVGAVCNGNCWGSIDNTEHIQADKHVRILCRLTLGIVEVRRPGDNSLL